MSNMILECTENCENIINIVASRRNDDLIKTQNE